MCCGRQSETLQLPLLCQSQHKMPMLANDMHRTFDTVKKDWQEADHVPEGLDGDWEIGDGGRQRCIVHIIWPPVKQLL